MWIEVNEVKNHLPKRPKDSHKGTFGKILNIAGSTQYVGASILSSISALKIGAGYVTLVSPKKVIEQLCGKYLDITYYPLQTENNKTISFKNLQEVLKISENYDIISIGSGLSTNLDTVKFVINFIENINKPMVIDADAINALSQTKNIKIPENSILTPHPKELSRLINKPVDYIQQNRNNIVKETAKKYNCAIVLKGFETVVSDGDKIYKNQTGNSSLAKAGTGDVLTGIIAGLYAQKTEAFYSACLGVYLHGLSADIASKVTTEYGLLASELVSYIPLAIKETMETN